MAEHRMIGQAGFRTGPIKRVLLTTAAIVLGSGSAAFSIAQVVAKTNPVLAHRLAPYDGAITADLAASLAGVNATDADRAQSDALSRDALRWNPTAVVALSTLGINAQFRGDINAARTFFNYSERLSRRDMQTQLWAIEDAVGRGQIDEALTHYNVALRVSPRLSDILFPVLASASAEPSVANALVRVLAKRPNWSDSFVNYLSSNSSDPQSTAQMFSNLTRAGGIVTPYANAAIVNALIIGGHAERAWAYYTTLHLAQRQRSRDPHFSAKPGSITQFDWLPNNEGGLVTSIQDGTFYFAAPPSVGGVLLQQVQFLPAGDYVLSGQVSGVDQVDDARPYWSLRCQDGRELGQIGVPNSAASAKDFSGKFHVPADCRFQTLALVARPSDAPGGLSGQINHVELTPVG